MKNADVESLTSDDCRIIRLIFDRLFDWTTTILLLPLTEMKTKKFGEVSGRRQSDVSVTGWVRLNRYTIEGK